MTITSTELSGPQGSGVKQVTSMSETLAKAAKEGRVTSDRSQGMFEISKTFSFSAAHQLAFLPPEHKCSRLHGHNYKVTMVLRSPVLDERMFVTDYADLDIVKKWIDETLDHKNLNEVLNSYTTAENLAEIIYYQFKRKLYRLYKVTVSETDSTTASYWVE